MPLALSDNVGQLNHLYFHEIANISGFSLSLSLTHRLLNQSANSSLSFIEFNLGLD